ncbi:hypothetical protein CK203_115431 [Vitis vinifera]|uniref:Uncharacterized protein n=1 Tax=Vitis vinifera TaxID=29760 RepID=A0A438CR29_VITVI|nr:hypothetical protein CK203_115431 [Vitis vinifera]
MATGSQVIRVKTIQSVRRRGRKRRKQTTPANRSDRVLVSWRCQAGGVNSYNGSPRLVGPTTTKQRVVDTIDVERSSNFSDVFEEEDNPNSNNGDHHRHCHHPLIRYWLLHSRIFFFTLETWLLKIENGCSWAFLLMSSHKEVKEKRENGLLIIQTFKEDWAMA